MPAPAPIQPLNRTAPDISDSPVIPTFVGKMTYYGTDGDPPPTQYYGSCGFLPSTVAGNFVAMNAIQYESTMCGQCVETTYQGNCAEGIVVDKCPGCPSGGIDTSIGIFAILVGSEDRARQLGVVRDVEWRFVRCGTACKG